MIRFHCLLSWCLCMHACLHVCLPWNVLCWIHGRTPSCLMAYRTCNEPNASPHLSPFTPHPATTHTHTPVHTHPHTHTHLYTHPTLPQAPA
jgi:hypothetical protein